MKTKKILGWLGTITATGLVGAAGYALAMAPQAAEIRNRLRATYDDLKSRVRGEMTGSKVEESGTHEAAQDSSATSEHTLEHGASGRERAQDHSRKPHVAQTHDTSSMHPFRAQRHG